MKVKYDSRTDTLSVILKDDARIAESDEDKPGVVLDYDEQGDLVSLEDCTAHPALHVLPYRIRRCARDLAKQPTH